MKKCRTMMLANQPMPMSTRGGLLKGFRRKKRHSTSHCAQGGGVEDDLDDDDDDEDLDDDELDDDELDDDELDDDELDDDEDDLDEDNDDEDDEYDEEDEDDFDLDDDEDDFEVFGNSDFDSVDEDGNLLNLIVPEIPNAIDRRESERERRQEPHQYGHLVPPEV